MSIPIRLAEKIRQWLAEFTAGTDPRLTDQRNLAVYLQALPLYEDLGGCIAIRPDGELIFVESNVDWSKPNVSARELEPMWRTIALASGSRRYPELRELLPPRGAEDIDCPDCAGTGRLREPPTRAGLICSACHGVGWRSRATFACGQLVDSL
jgi:hypothetical protein